MSLSILSPVRLPSLPQTTPKAAILSLPPVRMQPDEVPEPQFGGAKPNALVMGLAAMAATVGALFTTISPAQAKPVAKHQGPTSCEQLVKQVKPSVDAMKVTAFDFRGDHRVEVECSKPGDKASKRTVLMDLPDINFKGARTATFAQLEKEMRGPLHRLDKLEAQAQKNGLNATVTYSFTPVDPKKAAPKPVDEVEGCPDIDGVPLPQPEEPPRRKPQNNWNLVDALIGTKKA